jgi:hypothetical protein
MMHDFGSFEVRLQLIGFRITGSEPQKKKVAVTFEQFQKVTRALVMHLRQHEDSVEEGMSLCGVFFYHTCP